MASQQDNKPDKKEIETTGHEWDGLKEYNNPAPRWWLWVFYITIIWAVGYWVIYPSWPTLSGHTAGIKEWTQYTKLKDEQAEIAARQTKYAARFDQASLADIKADPELYEFARAGGAVAFKNNCAACHGSGAQGGKGYPNLNDDDWIWGGTLDEIYATLQYGIRSGHEKARDNQMPAFGKDGVLTQAQINDVADYVMQLSKGGGMQLGESAARGKDVFAQNCVACHGEQGEGKQELGGPRLNDAIWLYGSDKAAIKAQINNPKMGVMPYWKERLDDRTIKQLAIYVYSLGGGK